MPRLPAIKPFYAALAGLFLYYGLMTAQLLTVPIDYLDQVCFAAAAHAAFMFDVSPYSVDTLRQIAGPLPHDADVPPYLYPPSSLLMFAPLVLMPPADWFTGMAVINVVLATACAGFILRRLAPDRLSTFGYLAVGLYLAAYFGTLHNNWYGQINLAVLSLMLVVWRNLRSSDGWPILTGVALAIACLIKTYPLLFLPYLLARRQYAAAAACVGTVATAVAVSFVVLPGGLWRQWLTEVAPTGGYGQIPRELFSPASYTNQSLNGLTARIFTENPYFDALLVSPQLARTVPLIGAVLLLAMAAIALWRTRLATDRDTTDLQMATLLALMFIIGPLSWMHHLVYVLPGAIMLLGRVMVEGRWAKTVPAFVALLPMAHPVSPSWSSADVAVVLSAGPLFGVVTVFGWAWWRLIKRPPVAAAAASPGGEMATLLARPSGRPHA